MGSISQGFQDLLKSYLKGDCLISFCFPGSEINIISIRYVSSIFHKQTTSQQRYKQNKNKRIEADTRLAVSGGERGRWESKTGKGAQLYDDRGKLDLLVSIM